MQSFSDAQVSGTQLSDVAQPPVPLEQTAQVADEHGDGMPHVQSDANAPVAAPVVLTMHRLLDTCATFIMGNILSLLLDEASPAPSDCTALSLPDQQQPELSATALDRGMPSAQVQPSGIQVLAATASDQGMPDGIDPSLSHEGASTERSDSMADGVAALSAAAPCPPSPSSINVLMAPLLPTAEHMSELTQSMHSKPLYPPGTHPFNAMHNTTASMRVGLRPAGLRESTDYNWDNDPLVPSIHGQLCESSTKRMVTGSTSALMTALARSNCTIR